MSHRLSAVALFGSLLLLGTFGCGRPEPKRETTAATAAPTATAWLEDVTTAVGIDFVHRPGPIDGSYFMPQSIGSGAALIDFDGSGRLGILFLQNAGPKSEVKNVLYRQSSDDHFEDVSAGSGLDFAGFCMGATVGDVDGDGLEDVFVTEFGGDHFFLGTGDAHFRDVTREAGVDNPMWGTASSFVDFDRDGWLDLVVVNYVDLDSDEPCTDMEGTRDYCNPSNYRGSVTRLFHNRGADASGRWRGFEDRTAASGLGSAPAPGLGVLCADFDGDGWPDVFVAVDGRPNHLWINRHDGTFEEDAVARGLAFNGLGQPLGDMGVAWGDVDGDDLPDLFVTHLTTEWNTLWKQDGDGLFEDWTAEAGLTAEQWRGTGFGTVLADFDQDGDLDLAIVNGRVSRPSAPTSSFWDAYSERNQLFENDGRGRMTDVSTESPSFSRDPNVARALAVGDLDGDGAPDLVVTRIGGPASIYRDVAPRRGHWLMVRALVPTRPDGPLRDAIGAVVRVVAGERSWQRLVQPSQSYLAGIDPRVHFGLGATAAVDAIEVQWPDGGRERFPGSAADRIVEVRHGQGRPIEAP